jgi:hypothetical protein
VIALPVSRSLSCRLGGRRHGVMPVGAVVCVGTVV